jgi:hypothetical protein
MGVVRCGVHGVKCCWRCDRCPRCEAEDHPQAKPWKLQKGDYCPDCVKKNLADGYVWSEFYQNYVEPELKIRDG